jgi:Ca2+/Na+ antiporter
VRENCPDHQDGLLSYLELYYCALPNAKPLAFVIIVLWLSLLFSTIGIAASDFLCIDLSTLASILGLSESLTGVTFLAFGNGSPDVFSTFAAMRSNSGSLAIGELIGAATFITSVVAGSMALVRPFKVARRSFVRDVGYFVIAVSFSMILVADGRLHAWEAAAMVALYVFYVILFGGAGSMKGIWQPELTSISLTTRSWKSISKRKMTIQAWLRNLAVFSVGRRQTISTFWNDQVAFPLGRRKRMKMTRHEIGIWRRFVTICMSTDLPLYRGEILLIRFVPVWLVHWSSNQYFSHFKSRELPGIIRRLA